MARKGLIAPEKFRIRDIRKEQTPKSQVLTTRAKGGITYKNRKLYGTNENFLIISNFTGYSCILSRCGLHILPFLYLYIQGTQNFYLEIKMEYTIYGVGRNQKNNSTDADRCG